MAMTHGATPGTPAVDVGESIFLGRQPILDHRHDLFAYELLFRSGDRNSAAFGSDVQATATVISNAFHQFGIDVALGKYPAFINVSRDLLLSDAIRLLPSDRVVIEILETVDLTADIVARCGELRESGFTLALDDVVEFRPDMAPLLPLVAFIKVDLMQVAPGRLPELARRLEPWGCKLLAEKVETRERVDECKALGFEFFQGYYFAKPQIISGKKMSHSELTLMELLGLVLSDGRHAEIEETLKRDPGLAVNLLRLTNSVACGLRRRVETLGDAILLLGRRQLQRWLQLLFYAKSGGAFPSPLLQLAAERAKLMELLAAHLDRDREFAERAFMTGIMSLTSTLLSQPLADIVSPLPVADEVKDALLERKGRLGRLLDLCERLEAGDQAAMREAVRGLPEISTALLSQTQAEAMQWANSLGDPMH
jgi:EAL and modified HD-GYP domain-containing signal transduction protein